MIKEIEKIKEEMGVDEVVIVGKCDDGDFKIMVEHDIDDIDLCYMADYINEYRRDRDNFNS